MMAALMLSFFSTTAFAQRKKVAVVTMYCDKYIGTSNLAGGASMIAAVQTLADDPNFDLTSVLQTFHDKFFNEFAPQFPFDLIPESEVVTNPDYLAYESAWGETKADEDKSIFERRYLTVGGYKPLLESLGKGGEKSNQQRMVQMFGDKVDGVLFVNIDFEFTPKMAIGGMGTAGVQAYCRMKMWNKEGDKVFKINEFAMSKESVAMVAGIPVMKTDELLPMCQDATTRMIADLQGRLKKIANKAAEKL
ncbi:MAG: hypothetical protein RLZZ77_1718 [Bacteroidota bacterium]